MFRRRLRRQDSWRLSRVRPQERHHRGLEPADAAEGDGADRTKWVCPGKQP